MKIVLFIYTRGLFIVFGLGFMMQSLHAEPVWHCSRTNVKVADASDAFSLAGLGLDREFIQISLRDLYGVYEGKKVTLSTRPLSACIIRDSEITGRAMASIGLEEPSLHKAAKDHNTTYSTIHFVQNDNQMAKCIAQNHPAVGYLEHTTLTEAIGPCF